MRDKDPADVDVPFIDLFSGGKFYFGDPTGSVFTIEDIAHGLAHTCRFSGQCHRFYSVAEHSVLVSQIAGAYPLEALLHDAAEAFIGDVPGPLKELLDDYKKVEARVEKAIADCFGLNTDKAVKAAVKLADKRVLAAEKGKEILWGPAARSASDEDAPADIEVRCLSPADAQREFLEHYGILTGDGIRPKAATPCRPLKPPRSR